MVKNINLFPDPIIPYTFKDVYPPSDDTYLIIDYLKTNINENFFDGLPLNSIRNILDMGTGTGIIALFLQDIKKDLSKFTSKIYASDISKVAIKCATLNERSKNLKERTKFIYSDLFRKFPTRLQHSFDIIVFNPPYLPSIGDKGNNIIRKRSDSNWEGGEHGFEVFFEFLKQVKDFLNLNQKYYIYYISSSLTNLCQLNDELKIRGFRNKVLNRIHIFFEDIILNRLEEL
ncbi:MAG: methyltransferase [Candidatus Lokiarchaeota archaeon]|nr:methyltransferase [Candidatus Lokiarchaeota archaeon]